MKKVILLVLAIVLVGCSNNMVEKENSLDEHKKDSKQSIQKEEKLTALPFDVNSLQADLKRETELDPEQVDVYVVVSENTLISNFDSLLENVTFLNVLAQYVGDSEDKIVQLIKELEDSYDSGEKYSSTLEIDDVNIITTLFADQIIISVTSGDWIEKSVEKELEIDSQE